MPVTFAVWARHAGNPNASACLLILPDYRTVCGQDWRLDQMPEARHAYYQPVSVPQPKRLVPVDGERYLDSACSRCLERSWLLALHGELCILVDLTPYGQPVNPQLTMADVLA